MITVCFFIITECLLYQKYTSIITFCSVYMHTFLVTYLCPASKHCVYIFSLVYGLYAIL